MSSKQISFWILTVLVALVFLGAAAMKLVNYNNTSALEFAGWGYPDWFRYVVALLEIVGVTGLFVPKTRKYALLLLTVVMIGAIITHVLHDPLAYALLPLSLIVLMGIIYKLQTT